MNDQNERNWTDLRLVCHLARRRVGGGGADGEHAGESDARAARGRRDQQHDAAGNHQRRKFRQCAHSRSKLLARNFREKFGK